MKEITFNIFQLLYVFILQKIYPHKVKNFYLQNNNEYSNQIFFECGGGYWSYYCGIVKMMKETYPKEVLNKIVWIGSSAGTFPTVTAAFVDNPDNAMFFMQSLISYLPQTWYGGINKFNNIILQKCHGEYLPKYKEEILKNNSRVFLVVLNINILCPIFSSISFCYDFQRMHDFTESCITSHGIPFVTGSLNTTFITHPKKWYIKRMDAGVFTLLFGFLFGYKNIMPYGSNIPCSIIYPTLFRPYSLYNAWIHTCIIKNKQLYHLGYQDAKNNIDKMNKIVLQV